MTSKVRFSRRRYMAKNIQLVVFSIGKELYGVGIASVHEIVKVPDITEVPDAPAFLTGVINLRGKIVPVVDLRKRLRLAGKEKTKASRVLITENDGRLIGLLVDAVSEVLKLAPESVEAPPDMISSIGVEYITGVAKVEERLIILLELGKVLSVEDMRKLGAPADRKADALAA
jgi:purine-binding chemotaxis protein CheW